MDDFVRIKSDPRIHGGKATISGSRLTVEQVVRLYHAGLTLPEIARECGPRVDVETVRAAVQFYGRRYV